MASSQESEPSDVFDLQLYVAPIIPDIDRIACIYLTKSKIQAYFPNLSVQTQNEHYKSIITILIKTFFFEHIDVFEFEHFREMYYSCLVQNSLVRDITGMPYVFDYESMLWMPYNSSYYLQFCDMIKNHIRSIQKWILKKFVSCSIFQNKSKDEISEIVESSIKTFFKWFDETRVTLSVSKLNKDVILNADYPFFIPLQSVDSKNNLRHLVFDAKEKLCKERTPEHYFTYELKHKIPNQLAKNTFSLDHYEKDISMFETFLRHYIIPNENQDELYLFLLQWMGHCLTGRDSGIFIQFYCKHSTALYEMFSIMFDVLGRGISCLLNQTYPLQEKSVKDFFGRRMIMCEDAETERVLKVLDKKSFFGINNYCKVNFLSETCSAHHKSYSFPCKDIVELQATDIENIRSPEMKKSCVLWFLKAAHYYATHVVLHPPDCVKPRVIITNGEAEDKHTKTVNITINNEIKSQVNHEIQNQVNNNEIKNQVNHGNMTVNEMNDEDQESAIFIHPYIQEFAEDCLKVDKKKFIVGSKLHEKCREWLEKKSYTDEDDPITIRKLMRAIRTIYGSSICTKKGNTGFFLDVTV